MYISLLPIGPAGHVDGVQSPSSLLLLQILLAPDRAMATTGRKFTISALTAGKLSMVQLLETMMKS